MSHQSFLGKKQWSQSSCSGHAESFLFPWVPGPYCSKISLYLCEILHWLLIALIFPGVLHTTDGFVEHVLHEESRISRTVSNSGRSSEAFHWQEKCFFPPISLLQQFNVVPYWAVIFPCFGNPFPVLQESLVKLSSGQEGQPWCCTAGLFLRGNLLFLFWTIKH